MKQIIKKIIRAITSRLAIMTTGILFSFMCLVARLYDLQIIQGEELQQSLKTSMVKEVVVSPVRGNIYDRFGRPLAINQAAFQVQIDPSQKTDNDQHLLELIRLLHDNGDELMDEIPISKTPPYQYYGSSSEMLFKENIFHKKRNEFSEEQKEMGADKMLRYIREFFSIDPSLSQEEGRQLASLKYALYMKRYNMYQPVTAAVHVSDEIIAVLNERSEDFPGIFIETVPLRLYPDGSSFSHIIGYIGNMNETELENLKEAGYTGNEQIGKIGMEKEMEDVLRGSKGKQIITVDTLGRPSEILRDEKAMPGKNVFLTIDRELQKECEKILTDKLRDILLERLQDSSLRARGEAPISLEQILEATGLASIEEVKERIEAGEVTAQHLNIEPYSGAVVVVDIHSGEILSMVSFPSYDNNRFVNGMDNAYYYELQNDPTLPLFPTATQRRSAPGSTFKMVSTMAFLEEGVITPEQYIYDEGIFKEAGAPYPRCLIYTNYGATHGLTNLAKALEVSCNYYFYKNAFVFRQRDTSQTNTAAKGIEVLNEYAKKFGLGSKTGLEINEYSPILTDHDVIRSAIGQGSYSFTPVQIARYMTTLANGGTLYDLRLVKSIETAPGFFQDKPSVVHAYHPFQPQNLQAVYEGMAKVTSGGMGTVRRVFANFPIQVAGKTGTAQERSDKGEHAWFAGFAPYENPQIAIAVLLPYGYSSTYCAEIFREITQYYFRLDQEIERVSMENVLY